jgi:hypothetical protein
VCAAAIIGSRVARSSDDDFGSLQGRQGYLYKAQKTSHRRRYMHYDDSSKRHTQREGKCVSSGSRTPAMATDCRASRRGAWHSWETGVGASDTWIDVRCRWRAPWLARCRSTRFAPSTELTCFSRVVVSQQEVGGRGGSKHRRWVEARHCEGGERKIGRGPTTATPLLFSRNSVEPSCG